MKEVEESFRAAGVNARLEVLIGEGQDATVGAAVDGANAIEVWRALRLRLPPKGFWPVVLGKAFGVEGLRVNWEGSPADEIEMAASFEPERWVQERFDEDTDYYERAHGPWPSDVSPLEGFRIPREILSDGSRTMNTFDSRAPSLPRFAFGRGIVELRAHCRTGAPPAYRKVTRR